MGSWVGLCGEATQGQGLRASEWAHPALRQRIHVGVWDVWCCEAERLGMFGEMQRSGADLNRLGWGEFFW
jgi:hypothetical protein